MKSINMIIPYFGEFPNYFQLFLNSCKMNPTIDWTIITDNKEKYEYPDNVKKIKMTFSELRAKVQEKFDFHVALDKPYKLCDLRPAYGYIFPQLVQGYDYWGYCDLDVIYGDIRKFLTADVLTYPKVFQLGHFTLIRNEERYNTLFMNQLDGEEYYRKVFQSPESYNFDERFLERKNINDIFEKAGLSIYKECFVADIYTKSSRFILDIGDGEHEKRKNAFFLWNNGKLLRYIKTSDQITVEEYMYIHLQKRKMKVSMDSLNASVYKIIPNAFEKLECSFNDIWKNFDKIKCFHVNFQYYRIRYHNLVTKARRRLFKKLLRYEDKHLDMRLL